MIYEYEPETKRQSEEWKLLHEPRIKKTGKAKSKIKTMRIGFFNLHEVVHNGLVSAA